MATHGERVTFGNMDMFVDYITCCDMCGEDVGRENLTEVQRKDGLYYLCPDCLREEESENETD